MDENQAQSLFVHEKSIVKKRPTEVGPEIFIEER